MAKFYVGQKVRIINNTLNHDFKIGDIVTLDKACLLDYGYWDLGTDGWELNNDDCEPAEDVE
jgi:hypothetical protein